MSREKKLATLRRIMKRHELVSRQVAEITLYQPQSIRAMMCGQREVPERALRMLELHFGAVARD
jgi:hypothetical protein